MTLAAMIKKEANGFTPLENILRNVGGWHLFMRVRCLMPHVNPLMGFTVIEVIVAMSIMLFISAQVLVSFSSLRENATLTRGAQEFAFNIRRAQNMALAVAPVTIGGVSHIPQSIGIRISSKEGSNTKYFFFSDINDDKKYTDPSERIEPDINLPQGIIMSAINGAIPGNPEVHILFYSPEASMLLTNFNGLTIPAPFIPLKVTLNGPAGGTRVVTVRMSGQVSVGNP